MEHIRGRWSPQNTVVSWHTHASPTLPSSQFSMGVNFETVALTSRQSEYNALAMRNSSPKRRKQRRKEARRRGGEGRPQIDHYSGLIKYQSRILRALVVKTLSAVSDLELGSPGKHLRRLASRKSHGPSLTAWIPCPASFLQLFRPHCRHRGSRGACQRERIHSFSGTGMRPLSRRPHSTLASVPMSMRMDAAIIATATVVARCPTLRRSKVGKTRSTPCCSSCLS